MHCCYRQRKLALFYCYVIKELQIFCLSSEIVSLTVATISLKESKDDKVPTKSLELLAMAEGNNSMLEDTSIELSYSELQNKGTSCI